jgi:hypothetical protein
MMRRRCARGLTGNPVGQNAGSQTASSAQGIFCPRPERHIHPAAGTTLTHPFKLNVLNRESPSHEGIRINPERDGISAENASVLVVNLELAAEVFIDLPGKERNPPFVVLLIMKRCFLRA